MQSCKKDHIANYLLRQDERPTVLLIQETWDNEDCEFEIDNCLFIGSGVEENSTKRCGVAIALSPGAKRAYEAAGNKKIL